MQFGNASSGAYAAVIYLKISSESGNAVNFGASKTTVSPTTGQKIPIRNCCSSKLIDSVSVALRPELEFKNICCYTDLKVALYWIRSTENEWKPFVENRANEIRKLVPPTCCSHCPGKENLADLPSRGMTMLELVRSRLWHLTY